ncbi:MAG: hypothetical protein ABSG01_15850 [Anaerolineales bacterium]
MKKWGRTKNEKWGREGEEKWGRKVLGKEGFTPFDNFDFCIGEAIELIDRGINEAMDTAMMKYLTQKFPEAPVRSTTIEQVDEQTYCVLNGLIARDIKVRYHGEILPVQWDDIVWRELNHETEERE